MNFKKGNTNKVVTRKGDKYELDCAYWTTYQNFEHLYKRFGDKMEYAYVDRKLETPILMNCDGDAVENKDVRFAVELP